MRRLHTFLRVLFYISILAIIYDNFFNFYEIWGKWKMESTVYAILKLSTDMFIIWGYSILLKSIEKDIKKI